LRCKSPSARRAHRTATPIVGIAQAKSLLTTKPERAAAEESSFQPHQLASASAGQVFEQHVVPHRINDIDRQACDTAHLLYALPLHREAAQTPRNASLGGY
jgi:hypothetical protein